MVRIGIDPMGWVKRTRRVGVAVSLTLAVALAALLLTGCGRGAGASDKIGVAVTIPPLVEFAEAVGGDLVEVTAMVLQDDPHESRLTSSQMKAVSNARLYAKVGSGLEFEMFQLDNLLAVASDIELVDCSAGLDLVAMGGEATHGGEEGDGDAGGMDPHVWMSPPNAAIMVQNICHGLVQVDPDNRDYYETNRDAYVSELAALDADIREGLAGVSKRTFMVYHPSLGYFAAEYGLTMLSVEEGGKEPTGDLTRPIEQAKENDITVVFTSPLSNPQPAEVIAAEIGGRVMFVDPLAADYVSNLRGFLASLVEALE